MIDQTLRKIDYPKMGIILYYDCIGQYYRLRRRIVYKFPFEFLKTIKAPFLQIFPDGTVVAEAGFVWDGATGALDTPEVMLPSLLHDIICWAVAEGLLAKEFRELGDKHFPETLKLCGLSDNKLEELRAWYMGRAVLRWGQVVT